MADFPHSFLAHMREGAEQLAEPDCEDQVDEMDRFVEGRKIAGLVGNRAANNIGERSKEIDAEFAEKIKASRSTPIDTDPAIAKAMNHGEPGVTKERLPDGSILNHDD